MFGIKRWPVGVNSWSRILYIKICVLFEEPPPPPLLGVAEGVLLCALHLGKVKLLAHHPPVDVLDVLAGGLKVCCGVVRAGDKNLKGGGVEGRKGVRVTVLDPKKRIGTDCSPTWLSVPLSVGA